MDTPILTAEGGHTTALYLALRDERDTIKGSEAAGFVGCNVLDLCIETTGKILLDFFTEAYPDIQWDTFLQISMPCGQEYICTTAMDVPEMDVLCFCGDPTHYFFKHGQLPEKWAWALRVQGPTMTMVNEK